MKKTKNIDSPFVSIVVLNWNGIVYLEKCLQSLMSLTYPNYEVVVVDNGSSDGSPDMVKATFKGVRLITNDRNLGFAKGNNIGIKASKGDMIVLLNNDVVVDRAWLSELVKVAVASPRVGMASGVILQSKPSDIVWCAGNRIDAFTGYSWRIGYGKKLEEVGQGEDVDYFPACALLVTRQLVEKIGLLDEGYFFLEEDADWSLRARGAGYECKLATSAVAWHEGSATSRRVMKKAYYWNSVSSFRFLFKNFPVNYLFTALFFRLIFSSAFEIFIVKRPADYLLLKFAGFAWNIAKLPRTIAERKKARLLGRANPKNRLRECIQIARTRVASRCCDSALAL